MRVLFSHAYFLHLDPKQWNLGQPYAPLGTLYAAAWLRQHGYDVSLYDVMFVTNPAEVSVAVDTYRPDLFVIYDDGFNYLTKMCLTNMREAAFTMMGIAKQKGCKVIVSSSDATDHFDNYLDKGADFVMLGEAEMTLLELAGKLSAYDDDYMAVQGIAFRLQGSTIKTQRRAVMKDLDELPLPAWDLADIDTYRKWWMRSSGYFSINLGTTRGCPYKCNWCAKPIYGNRYNSRSPENVIAEIKLLKQYGFDHIWFCDDIFGLKPGWVSRFADLVEQESLKFRFKIQSRADLLLQEDNIRALARSGCENVWMGAESGSQKILDAMDKGITIAQIKEATILLKQHGIKPSFFIQFGYPGETKEDIRKTIKMVNDLLPSSIGVSVSYPLPGTVFHERVKAELAQKANWTDSDELMLMFRNTYQPRFYKQLHRYVQNNHRMHLAFNYVRGRIGRWGLFSLQTIRKMAAVCYYVPAVFFGKLRLNALEK